MNILMLAEDYLPNIGGIATHGHYLTRALLSLGCDIRIITTRKLSSSRNITIWKTSRLQRDDVQIIEIPVIYQGTYCFQHRNILGSQD